MIISTGRSCPVPRVGSTRSPDRLSWGFAARIKTIMDLVATLIAEPDHAYLTEEIIGKVRDSLADDGAVTEAPLWLADETACDIVLGGIELAREMWGYRPAAVG